MSDVVVTVPKRLWSEWLGEGDLARADDSGRPARRAGDHEYGFCFGPGASVPRVEWDERVYIVAHGMLRGHASLTKIVRDPLRFGGQVGGFALVRRGQAFACTLDTPIRGFRGWRYRWWDCVLERPFAEWRTAGVR